jgi:hypothetical protein
MKKLKSSFFFKIVVLAFLVTYLAGSFANMLFIPRYVQVYSKIPVHQGLSFTKLVKYNNFHTHSFLQIIDKYTLDNDQVNSLWFIPKCFIIIFAGFCFSGIKSRRSFFFYHNFFSFQYTYLSFCKLRI